jgi:hypothetical protein
MYLCVRGIQFALLDFGIIPIVVFFSILFQHLWFCFLSYMCFMEAGSDHFVFLSFNTMYLQNENAKIRRRKCEKFHNAFSHFRFVKWSLPASMKHIYDKKQNTHSI